MKNIVKIIFSFLMLVFFTQNIQAQNANFGGIAYTGEKPPDPVIAVGTSYVVEAVNKEIAVYDKAGNLVSEQSFSSFFSNQSPPDQIFDPKLTYDQYSDRFIFLAAGRNNDYSNSNYMLAVTKSPDPTDLSSNGWYKYKLTAIDNSYPQYHIDFPGLGYDEQAIYLTTDKLGGTNSYYPKITILKKSEVYSGSISYRKDFIDFSASDGTQPEHLKPMKKFGNSSGYYFVNTQTPGEVRIWSIQHPLSNPNLSEVATKSLGNYSSISDAVQKGSSNTIDMQDYRISDVVCYDGYLYGAYTAENTQSNGSMIVYFKLDTGHNFNLLINGKIETANKYYYYPQLQPDNNGDIAFVFNQSSTDDYAGVAWTILYTGSQSVEPIEWLKKGVASYYNPLSGVNRWGDYSGVAADPSNNQYVWICGEWANNNNQWSTQIGEINSSSIPNVVVDQKLSNGTRVGYLKNWNGSSWGSQYTPPDTFSFPVNSTQTILGEQAIYSNQKYNNWNGLPDVTNQHSFTIDQQTNNLTSHFLPTYSNITIQDSADGSVVSGNIYFQDPWFIDYSDPNFGNQKRNEGTSAPFVSRTSPFSPNYSTSYGGDTYKGVFLNQNPNFLSDQPIYSVRAPLTQTISVNGHNHTGYFQNWNTSNAQLQQMGSNPNGYDQKAVVFTNNPSAVTANYKATQLSGNSSAFANSSQRKIVRTTGGNLYMVYTSMGHVWYEESPDNGSTWILCNGGKPLDSNGGKLPSIASHGNDIGIVWEESNGGAAEIQIACGSGFSIFNGYPKNVFIDITQSYSNDLNPAIAYDYYGRATVVWENKDSYVYSAGLVARYGPLSQFSFFNSPTWDGWDTQVIPSTNSASLYPTISSNKSPNNLNNMYYQIAWVQNSAIDYCMSTVDSQNPMNFSAVSNVSSGSYPINTMPCIMAAADGTARIVWKGYYYPGSNAILVFRSSNNTRFWYFGSNIRTPQVTQADNNKGYYVTWNESSDNSTRFTDSHTLSTIYNLNTSGQNVQLSNGATSNDMYASVFNNTGLPYYFKMTPSIGSIDLNKSSATASTNIGRGGVVVKDSVGFYFRVRNVQINGKSNDFIEAADSLKVNSLAELNKYLVSKPFILTDNSSFKYTILYGVTDTSKASTVLKNNSSITYQLELVDANTGKKLGKLNDITFNQNNISSVTAKSYKVNTSGIGGKQVALKLNVSDNFNAKYILTESFTNLSNTLKRNPAKEITYKGTQIIKNFELEQNYPNPFNPTTSISYQLPKEGLVTLSVYDILGRKVETLVNGIKNTGHYSVEFNGADLASGVYIYKLNIKPEDGSKGFTSVKKLMLLK